MNKWKGNSAIVRLQLLRVSQEPSQRSHHVLGNKMSSVKYKWTTMVSDGRKRGSVVEWEASSLVVVLNHVIKLNRYHDYVFNLIFFRRLPTTGREPDDKERTKEPSYSFPHDTIQWNTLQFKWHFNMKRRNILVFGQLTWNSGNILRRTRKMWTWFL